MTGLIAPALDGFLTFGLGGGAGTFPATLPAAVAGRIAVFDADAPVTYGLAGDDDRGRFYVFHRITGSNTWTTGVQYVQSATFQIEAYAPTLAECEAMIDALNIGFSPHADDLAYSGGVASLSVPGVVGTDPQEYQDADGRSQRRMHLDVRFEVSRDLPD